MPRNRLARVLPAILLTAALLVPAAAWSMPEFARRYNLSCSVCHDAFPRLNAFGENFAGMNYKLPNWRGIRDSDKRILGLDAAGTLPSGRVHWFTQVLWNDWEGFLDAAPGRDFEWLGGFGGLDYIRNDRWSFSLLYNYAEADDFEDTGTIYEGIAINSVTFSASYYLCGTSRRSSK